MQPKVLTPDCHSTELAKVFDGIRLVATDMDGTLTHRGEFTPALLDAFERLRQANIEVMLVTGRSAGWVSGLVNYLPVVGAIAENGGLYIDKRNPAPQVLPDIPRMSHHRDRLAATFHKLKARYPNLLPALDNAYRITDWTFDIGELTSADLTWMQDTCAAQTMGFTYSNVQCHLKVARQNKAAGLQKVLRRQFPHLSCQNVVTVGDSPNDESLFEREQFPHSVGVANVARYLPELTHRPAYLTTASEADGFVELVDLLVGPKISCPKT